MNYNYCVLGALLNAIFLVNGNVKDPMCYFPVDKGRALDEAYAPDDLVCLREVSIATTKPDVAIRQLVVPDLLALFKAAADDGIVLHVTSGYRSYERQSEVFAFWKEKKIKAGCSTAHAEEQTNLFCAYPGHSEHQLGTALDILSAYDRTLEPTKTNNDAWQWLADHAENFGFVFSYPEGKTAVTGYGYEPWHVRWVGKKHARALAKRKYKDPGNKVTSTQHLAQVYESMTKKPVSKKKTHKKKL